MFAKHLKPPSTITSFQYVTNSILLNQSRTIVLDLSKKNISHISPFIKTSETFPYPGLSYQVGSTINPLKHVTLAELLCEQVLQNGDSEALISTWQNIRWTYRELDQRTDELAKSFWALGVRKNDRLAIMAGNCAEYVLVWKINENYIDW